MSGLFEALTSATSALSAHRLGLDVTGQNMANVNTVGYSRRVLQLAEVSSADPRNAGRGVEVARHPGACAMSSSKRASGARPAPARSTTR